MTSLANNQKAVFTTQKPARIFSKMDCFVVKKAVKMLQGYEYSVINLRFWNQNTLDEIAEILDLTWKEVEAYLNSALEKLKAICLQDQDFSRFQHIGDMSCKQMRESFVLSKPFGTAA